MLVESYHSACRICSEILVWLVLGLLVPLVWWPQWGNRKNNCHPWGFRIFKKRRATRMMPTKSNAALGWAEAAATGGGAPRLRRGAGGGGGLCQGARRRLLRAGKPRISPKQEAGGRGPPKRVVVPLKGWYLGNPCNF